MVLEIPERTLSPVVTMVYDAFKRLWLGVGEITLFHSFKSSFFFFLILNPEVFPIYFSPPFQGSLTLRVLELEICF